MPITTLDPITALVVIDLQAGLAGAPTIHPFDEVVANAAVLASAFRAKNLPVVLVNAAGSPPGRSEQGRAHRDLPEGFTDLVRELDEQPQDKTLTKFTWGAFHRTGLAEHLTGAGATQVVVCGVATSVGVESTAREAYAHGFHVTLALDAMTDLNAEAHANSVERIFPKLGETGSTADVLAHLERL